MANKKNLAKLKRGVKTWNKWRWKNPEILSDLSGGDLSGANLDGANLSGADLSGADLSGADLSGAELSDTDLRGANLGGANLSGANLGGANLDGAFLIKANLSEADLIKANLSEADFSSAILCDAYLWDANLSGANLQNADFTNSTLSSTIFANTDFSLAKGLDSMSHIGPSHISIDTLYKSAGIIPEDFLRGCGLNDWEIEATKLYRKELSPEQVTDILYRLNELRTNPAIQFNSCFISYSSLDREFSEKLYSDLQEKGVRCWFAPEHMKIGDRIRTRIDEAIRLQDKLLLVLSIGSIESQWVEQEVETALEKERNEERTILCPIRLDESVMSTNEAWASFIKKTRHIGDFSAWSDEGAYQKAFNRLLRDLKAEAVKE